MTEAVPVHRTSVEAFRTEAPARFCEFLAEAGKIVIIENNEDERNGN